MTNNDLIRKIRYAFNLSDDKMILIFSLADKDVSRTEVCDWLKKDDDPEMVKLEDKVLATFLNGFINFRRGKKDGPQHPPEKTLNNNIVLRKLRIALNFKEQDMLETLELSGFQLSKHELSAFFRKPEQNQYRECQDQVLRKFMQGLEIKFRTL